MVKQFGMYIVFFVNLPLKEKGGSPFLSLTIKS